MHVDIKTFPELRVGAVHHVGPYTQISKAFERLGGIAGRAGLIDGSSEMVALYYDDPETTPADQLQSDAAIMLPPDASLPAGLSEQRIPSGQYASTVHTGPYEQLPDAWARFMGEWLPSSDYRLREGASCEVYLNDPMTVAKSELLTELRIPVDAA
jgi:AraC family transcriptional regulator